MDLNCKAIDTVNEKNEKIIQLTTAAKRSKNKFKKEIRAIAGYSTTTHYTLNINSPNPDRRRQQRSYRVT